LKLVDRSRVVWWQNLLGAGKLDASKVEPVPIAIEMTPCEKVTRIFYTNIDAILRRTVTRAGQTQKPVTLDEVFELLLQEKILPFMDKLEPPEKKCFDNFTLWQWLQNQDATGFEFRQYTLNTAVKDVLTEIAKSLRDVQSWRRYALTIEVTGYTDPTKVDPQLHNQHYLSAAATGIATARDPLHIAYAGCADTRLTGASPRFLDFESPVGTPLGETFDDNCELGAARAWVAAAFLRERLGTNHVEYRYGTGGVAGPAGDSKEGTLHRKVGVRIAVKAATGQ
jgi:hypothetical protein